MDKKKTKYPRIFLEHIKSITNKRANIVIDHIMRYGSITTEDLEKTYGYSHPPRAARDVREASIPLVTSKIRSKEGRYIAVYSFGDLTKIQKTRVKGRILFSKKFKQELYELGDGHCFICSGEFEERYLQIDHLVPYNISGDVTSKRKIEDFMLLCSSCNRAKSWSCEHCENGKRKKKPGICIECYWGNSKNYNHIALKEIRRLDLQWQGDEVKYYKAIKIIAERNNIELPDFVKKIIADQTI